MINNEKILSMDPFILLSWINTKLRDEFSNLKELCISYDLKDITIKDKLKNIDYTYNEQRNQFVSVDT